MDNEPSQDWRTSHEGQRAVDFINLLTHTGDYSGKRFRLRPWQEYFVRQLFGSIGLDGRRIIRNAFLMLPRKNGKTELIAAICVYCLLGLGKHGQEIYSAAADREQASRIFKAASQMVRSSPYLNSLCTILDSQKRITVERLNNTYVALSSEAPTKHGLSPAIVLFDELHAQKNRDLWDALTTGFGARAEPLTIAITTAGSDRQSLCHQEYEYACKVRDGVLTNPNYLPVIYAADPQDDWTSEATWRKANPALGDYLQLDFLRDECKKAQDLPTEENRFRQLYLNQWVSGESRFLSRAKWDACGVQAVDAESLRGCTCFAGLDLSTTTDITALVLVFPHQDGTYSVLPWFWVPEDGAELRERRDRVPYQTWGRLGFIETTPGPVIDYDHIRLKVNELAKTYVIKVINIDPYNATQLAGQLQGDGLPIQFFRQGMISMNEPTKELERLVMGGKIHTGNHPVMNWMADNACVERDAAGNMKVSKSRSREKVDGIISLIMGLADASSAQPATADFGLIWL